MAEDQRGGLVGRQLGAYLLTDLLGAGGMAEVYRARDVNLDREVAVKILPQWLATDQGYVERFRDEARRVAKLNHPHIIPIYFAGEQDGQLYMVMPVVQESLRKRMQRRGLPTPEQAINLVLQIADALAAAHKIGLVHRDVKPENILIDTDGNAMLTDFGIAREVHRPSKDGKRTIQTMSANGLPVGTPEYMAPEHFLGGSVGHEADIYALGCVLYELLTSHTPREANDPMGVAAQTLSKRRIRPPMDRNPRVWPALDRAVMSSLEFEPNDRYPDMERFAFALQQSLKYRDAAGVPPEALADPVRRPGRRTTVDLNRKSRPDGGIGTSRPAGDARTARPGGTHASRTASDMPPMYHSSRSAPGYLPTAALPPSAPSWVAAQPPRKPAIQRYSWVGLVALVLVGIAAFSLGGILREQQNSLVVASLPTATVTPTLPATNTPLPTNTARPVVAPPPTNTALPPTATPLPAPLSFAPSKANGTPDNLRFGFTYNSNYTKAYCTASQEITNVSSISRTWSWSGTVPKEAANWTYTVELNGDSTLVNTFSHGTWPSGTLKPSDFMTVTVNAIPPTGVSVYTYCESTVTSFPVQLQDSGGVTYPVFYVLKYGSP